VTAAEKHFSLVSDGWPFDHFVGKASAISQPTRPTQPAIPPGSVKRVVTHYMG